MAAVTMVGDTEDALRRFEAYERLLRLSAGYDDMTGAVPQMAVVGIESHGKSSLVQAYVGFPCTFIGSGTATRCPVEYTLVHDESCYDPVVQLSTSADASTGDTIPASQLEGALGRHMRSLGDGFSSQPVRVRVRSKDCVNIVLLDLPGIIINPAEGKEAHKRKVDEIVQFYAVQPSVFLILVEKAVPSANSEALPKEMKRLVEQARPTWKRECCVVATAFDLQLKGGNLSSIEDAVSFYKSSQRDGQPLKHYVSLLPKPPGEDPVRHIRRQIPLENDMVDGWVRQLTNEAKAGEVFPADFKKQIGLENAKKAIQDKFYELISANGAFSRLRQSLRENKLHLEAEVKRRKALLDGVLKPGNLRSSVDSLRKEFLKDVFKLFQYTSDMRRPFDSKCMDFYQEVEKRAAEQRDEELAPPVPFEPEWRSRLTVLCKEDEMIRSEVMAPLLGSTQINRVTLVFKYLVLAAEHENWADPGLQKRVFGHLAGSPSTKVNYDKGIRELVKGGLTENLTESVVLNWYLDHLEWIIRHNGQLVIRFVLDSGRFGDLKDSKFPARILEDFEKGVKTLIEQIGVYFRQSAWVHSQYVAHMQVAELVEILEAIPRAERDFAVHKAPAPDTPAPTGALSPGPPPPPPPPAAAAPTDDAEDDFVESSAPPSSGAARAQNGPSPQPQANGGTQNQGLSSRLASAFKQNSRAQPSNAVAVSPTNDDEYFNPALAQEQEGAPTSGLPPHVISAVCNRKHEGTPAYAKSSIVCAWVRETYFFNLILLLRQLEFLVNSMVVLELNGDVSSKKTIDDAVGQVLQLNEEELEKLRDLNLVEIEKKYKEDAEMLQKVSADHAEASEAIALLEQPRHFANAVVK